MPRFRTLAGRGLAAGLALLVAAMGGSLAAEYFMRAPLIGLSAGTANALDNPPACTGSDKALQWDGAAWSCATISAAGAVNAVIGRSAGDPALPGSSWTQLASVTITHSSPSAKILLVGTSAVYADSYSALGAYYYDMRLMRGGSSLAHTTTAALPNGGTTRGRFQLSLTELDEPGAGSVTYTIEGFGNAAQISSAATRLVAVELK